MNVGGDMTELRRRHTESTAPDDSSSRLSSDGQRRGPRPNSLFVSGLVVAVCICAIIFAAARRHFLLQLPPRPVLYSAWVSPSDEAAISAGILPFEDSIPALFSEGAVACMPTVTRRSGGVEYVSNAIKSWRLATNGSTSLRRLAVFDMDVPASSDAPVWLRAVFDTDLDGTEIPSWLMLRKRESEQLQPPRKNLHGDSEERVRWRSKEALDYAEVLRRCADLTKGTYVIIVQDDVLFTQRVSEVLDWCNTHMVDKILTDEKTGRRRMVRVCSVSLFDLPGTKSGIDGHALDASNMVARVWKVDRVPAMEKYIHTNFDEAPVDWLADRICKSQRRKTLVMDPNPVRHRGKVSSFDQNDREGLLT